MATFQASLRTLSTSGIVAGGNGGRRESLFVLEQQGGVRFTTAFLAELDPATGDMAYINAGHNVPILRKKSGAVERLEAGGIPIGIFAESPYQVGTTRLEHGDWLVIFTDGIVEAENGKQRRIRRAGIDPAGGSRIGLGSGGNAAQNAGGVGSVRGKYSAARRHDMFTAEARRLRKLPRHPLPVHPVERVHAFFLLHAVSHTLLEIRLCCLPVRGRSRLVNYLRAHWGSAVPRAPLQSLLP